MTVGRWVALFLMLPLGCSFSKSDESEEDTTTNTCHDSSDCGENGRCSGGRCRAIEGQYGSFLFEVTAPGAATSADFSGITFLATRDVDPTGGRFDLELGSVAEVTGLIEPPPVIGREPCVRYDFDAIPLRVTLAPTERLLGLSARIYTALAECADDACEQAAFGLRVPPGDYSVYVKPEPGEVASEDICEVVPQLFRQVEIGPARVYLPLELPDPSSLNVTVHSTLTGVSETGENEAQLDGYTVDIVDSVSGRRLSTARQLGSAADAEDHAEYVVALEYSAPIGDTDDAAPDLVRLSPPEDLVAPAVLMERAGLELFAGEAVIEQLRELPPAITLEGRVERANAEPALASVTLRATALDFLEPGTLASYERTVETIADGRFQVQLFPGTYRVTVVPPLESELAVVEAEWDVASEPAIQAGRTVTLPEGPRLIGSVVTPSGRALAGANVQAVASTSNANASVLQAALGEAPFVPRANAGVTDADGRFALLSDPPWVDVSVRPTVGSGFAWLVRPNVPVTVPDSVDLGNMALPLPVPYSGHVTVLDGVVLPGALIRAYVLLDDPAEAVVQVAESRADAEGGFELLLPERLEREGSQTTDSSGP